MSDNQINQTSMLNAPAAEPVDIVSVNKKGSNDNKVGKAVFWLILGAILVGGLTWFAQRYAAQKKEQLKQSNTPKSQTDTAPIFNPEKTGVGVAALRLGADGTLIPPSQKVGNAPAAKPPISVVRMPLCSGCVPVNVPFIYPKAKSATSVA